MTDGSELHLWSGLIGSILVAWPPIAFEVWRYRHQNLRGRPSRSEALRQLNAIAAEQDLHLALTGWSRWQSLSLGMGAFLIGLSFVLQLCGS